MFGRVAAGAQRLERRDPAAIVVPDGTWNALRPAIDAGYALDRRIGIVGIYVRTP